MVQIVKLFPTLSEGYFDGAAVGRPEPFTVEVGSQMTLEPWKIEGWKGRVVSGHPAYLKKRVMLTPRIRGQTHAVVAQIFGSDEVDFEHRLFSGICGAEGLE